MQVLYSYLLISVELKEKIFDHITPLFKASIKLEALLPYLQEHHLVTDDELKIYKLTTVQKTGKLFEYIRSKEHGMLQKLLCCLTRETTHLRHNEVANELRQRMKDMNLVCQDICLDCKLKGIESPSYKAIPNVLGKIVNKFCKFFYIATLLGTVKQTEKIVDILPAQLPPLEGSNDDQWRKDLSSTNSDGTTLKYSTVYLTLNTA